MAKGQIKPEFERVKKEWLLDKLFDALKWWLSRKSAIAYAWLNLQTVYDRMEKMPDFSKKMDNCEEYWIWIVENVKRKKIVDERYRPAIEKELSSKRWEIYWNKEEINLKVDSELTDDQIAIILSKYKKNG